MKTNKLKHGDSILNLKVIKSSVIKPKCRAWKL